MFLTINTIVNKHLYTLNCKNIYKIYNEIIVCRNKTNKHKA